MSRFDPTPDRLPPSIPIFPLPGALLLPRGRLPLNIFEPRYLNMTEDALAAGRMIGMIQPSEEGGLFEVGCAGRIVSFGETDDGRLLITLLGVCRFRIAEEVATTRGYRRAAADWSGFVGDLEPAADVEVDRDRLFAAVKAYFAVNGLSADSDQLRGAPDELLVNTLAMICPFDPMDKQALLECSSLCRRAKAMIGMMEAATVDGGKSGAARPN